LLGPAGLRERPGSLHASIVYCTVLFKFDTVIEPPPHELEQPGGCFLFQPGPMLNEPEPRVDAGAWCLQLYFDCCALSVILFPAPPRPPRAAEPAPLPRVRKQSGSACHRAVCAHLAATLFASTQCIKQVRLTKGA
jgi:hypothetical protein